MGDKTPVATVDDVEETDSITYAAAPLDYLRHASGSDGLLLDLKFLEYGPTQLEDALFVCPDCNTSGDIRLYARYGQDEMMNFALIQCPNCEWTNSQPVLTDDDDL